MTIFCSVVVRTRPLPYRAARSATRARELPDTRPTRGAKPECGQNLSGFPEGVTGAEFAERAIEQAKRFGVELLSAQNVVSVGNDQDAHFVENRSWSSLPQQCCVDRDRFDV